MANDRITPSVVGISAFRDRPLEDEVFNRIEAARHGGDRPPKRRRPAPQKPQPPSGPTAAGDLTRGPDDTPIVGTKLNVIA